MLQPMLCGEQIGVAAAAEKATAKAARIDGSTNKQLNDGSKELTARVEFSSEKYQAKSQQPAAVDGKLAGHMMAKLMVETEGDVKMALDGRFPDFTLLDSGVPHLHRPSFLRSAQRRLRRPRQRSELTARARRRRQTRRKKRRRHATRRMATSKSSYSLNFTARREPA